MAIQEKTRVSTTQEQPPALCIPRAGSMGGRGNNNTNPPVSLSFYGDDQHHQRDEAARMRNRITELLSDIERGLYNA